MADEHTKAADGDEPARYIKLTGAAVDRMLDGGSYRVPIDGGTDLGAWAPGNPIRLPLHMGDEVEGIAEAEARLRKQTDAALRRHEGWLYWPIQVGNLVAERIWRLTWWIGTLGAVAIGGLRRHLGWSWRLAGDEVERIRTRFK